MQSLFKYGTRSANHRSNGWVGHKVWTFLVLDLSRERQPVEALCLMGCLPSYYPRNKSVLAPLPAFSTGWMSAGSAGYQEKAVGECDRLFGEEGLFEKLVEENRVLYDQQEFDEIVVLDPHAYVGSAAVLSALRCLVSREALHDVSRRAAGTAQAAF